ncbi:MAG TPA: hypothetical protein VE978_22340 [Chitinophagales bacterium]|nr:hypothetical protein [Chitinophagales bacterium]
MKTEITLSPSEFDESVFSTLQKILRQHHFTEIKISLVDNSGESVLSPETPEQVKARIEKAIEEFESGRMELVSMVWDKEEKYFKPKNAK